MFSKETERAIAYQNDSTTTVSGILANACRWNVVEQKYYTFLWAYCLEAQMILLKINICEWKVYAKRNSRYIKHDLLVF
jgi:hypothetical protein